MRTDALDFPLPQRLIALHPAAERSAARLLVADCRGGTWEHRVFRELDQILAPGDLLVLNDTRVLAARLVARKASGGGVEGLWLEDCGGGRALCMLSGRSLRPGTELLLRSGEYRLRLLGKAGPGRWLVEDVQGAGWLHLLAAAGATPLPPYIRNRRREAGQSEDSADDRARYQTVWARAEGAVAAPTASLHFDAGLLDALAARGVRTASATLHVGPGTFLPVETARVEDHPMHAERFSIPEQTVRAIAETRAGGGRVIAAGTTVCRALEHAARTGEREGETRLFILPGFDFRWTDALLTNFHVPRSTLLALVAAFAQHAGAADGLALVKQVYAAAVAAEYRFFSYGDATLWRP
ncbi:MAG: tRNA preQ1(34) S-adenosylmethionine ribosyltransferase-isomerase QueA [Planctomycetota bacterium]|nr:MAG: tRNA preQ1(34) S-adenosylmethionine ribosyltransferase-isomerase QueA [Planctomycetota bacterium]